MYIDPVQRAKIFETLHRIDEDLAEQHRAAGCPRCGGPLHRADYERKPRGGPVGLSNKLSVRIGLCCGREGCRRRSAPPSVLFLGRHVYFGAIIVAVVAMRQRRRSSASARRLRQLFGVSWKTVNRWMDWFAEVFPRSPQWRRVRGLVSAMVRNDELPASLLEVFEAQGEDEQGALIATVRLVTEGVLP